ncbi:MAG: MFS transporter [Thiolinea sp.]
MFHRRPLGLNTVFATTEAGSSLARLNGLEGFSRAILVSVVPLLALEALGSKESVAHMYLAAALFTFCITLNFSRLERWLQRRWIVTLAGGFLCTAAVLLYLGGPWAFALGIGLRASAASLFSVCLSLYIMDYITRQHLKMTESRRMVYAGAAWLSGPVLGAWLWDQLHFTPFLISMLAALLMVLYFWRLRLGENPILTRSRQKAPLSPLRAVPRYFSQPRLRIAYFITLSRAIYWSALFIYGPIYVVEAGLPTWVAGVLLSGISGLLLFSPLVRRIAEQFSTKRVIITALSIIGLSMLGLGSLGKPTAYGLLLWCSGALGGICLDVLGNIPFMRLVKSYERTDMTMVFSTWREMSELITPLSITLITLLFPFSVFYLALGLALLGVAVAATWLPNKL